MKLHKLTLAMAASVMLAACSTFSPQNVGTYRVGPEYTATGNVEGVKAYVYGERTLLQYQSPPYFLSITDATGNAVRFEQEGQYYRLERTVNDFTVRTGLVKTTTFHLLRSKVPAPSPLALPKSTAQPTVKVFKAPETLGAIQVQKQETADLSAALGELQQQLTAVRASIEHGAPDVETIEKLNARMDQIQAKLANTSSSVLMVYFDLYKTGFEPKPEVASLLLSVAQHAERIKVRGRTDSAVAGPADARIAKQRAMSAQSYLVNHGVSPDKIQTSWLASGDFIAPNTVEGRSLNRRVEIEFETPNLNALRRLNGNQVATNEGD